MADLLALSTKIIDEGLDEPVNRLTFELSEIDDEIALVESFSHVVAFRTGDGLLLFDASLADLAPTVLGALRSWSDDRVDTLVYTHGHVDHVGGARAILDEALDRGDRRPAVVAHEAVPDRFRRYDLTNGYNAVINLRQFKGRGLLTGSGDRPRFPSGWVEPSVTYGDRLTVRVGDLDVELRHGLGETDDHTWAWIPTRRAVCVGDFVIWAFPNAGNPQKVQRYPLEWARTLREMAALEPELLLPAHGLPVSGRERIARVLGDTATALESIVEQTLALMNEGAPLDDVIHTVRVDEELLARPYLRPVYDDPEFVVRNVWRRYGGWYDGNPARLKPAPDADLAAVLAALAGGADVLTARAIELADAGELRIATHLVELAAGAAPDDSAVHAARAEVYDRRRRSETSLMARGIFGRAAEASRVLGGDG
jgi:alkyl sulfatase BDS1-like metallo-beta-lactamase superfamily hydrolase